MTSKATIFEASNNAFDGWATDCLILWFSITVSTRQHASVDHHDWLKGSFEDSSAPDYWER